MTASRALAAPHSETSQSQAEMVQCLLSIGKSVRQLFGIRLASIGIMVGQDQLLLILLDNDTQTGGKLASSLGIRASTISKMADVCERKGWMYRTNCSEDNRRVFLSLTQDGRATAIKVQEVYAELENELAALFAVYDDTIKAMRRMEELLSKRLSRLR